VVKVAQKAHVLNPEQRNLKHQRPERRQHVTDIVAQQMDRKEIEASKRAQNGAPTMEDVSTYNGYSEDTMKSIEEERTEPMIVSDV
jgi:hypothetical protein